jgi:hypothetical protein
VLLEPFYQKGEGVYITPPHKKFEDTQLPNKFSVINILFEFLVNRNPVFAE